MSSAASLVVFGSMIAGCAAQHARMAAVSHVDGKPAELGFATRALAALNANDIPTAIGLAEKAVARSPSDAPVRTLLGNAYFAGGRFASAEAAYRDSLTIDADQPQAILRLALVEIAQGKDNRAVAMLKDARALLDASDYGLALALAGRTSEAIAVLEPAARERAADGTVRQNLALAHALSGDWQEARVIAAQDVPESQLDARIQQWMQLAKPKHAADQVASVVGVTPALADPGQPVQLALEKRESRQPHGLDDGAIAVASEAQAPLSVRVPIHAPLATAVSDAARPSSPKAGFVGVTQASSLSSPIVGATPVATIFRPGLAALAHSAMVEAKAALAWTMPLRANSASRPAKRRAALVHAVADSGKSHAVVQLGAYASPERVLAAWTGEARKFHTLASYAPMSARFVTAKGTFYRLSVRGFASVDDAKALCSSLHRAGGACFVRNVAGDLPVNMALR